MPKDPKYVRLAEHLTRVAQADIAGGSGWSIAGNSVVPFPEDQAAARYVRQRLAAGVLEPASKAEYDEEQKSNQELARAASSGETLQENRIQEASKSAAQRRAAKRAASNEESEAEGDNGSGSTPTE